MGLIYIDGVVTGPTGYRAAVRFLVDSGATYTLLPEPAWRAIELAPRRSVTFTLADRHRDYASGVGVPSRPPTGRGTHAGHPR
jgi:hypothetical protein